MLDRAGNPVQTQWIRRLGRWLAAVSAGWPVASTDERATGAASVFLVGCHALFACLVITGWWFLRNILVYDELVGTATMLEFFGERSTTIPRLYLEEFEGLRVSYWGLFGAFSIYAHRVYYSAMDLLSLISTVGLLMFSGRNRKNQFV